MGCNICKTLGCSCKTCVFDNLNEPKQIKISEDKVMCPNCGEVYDYESNAMQVDEYSYRSHQYFQSLKEKESSES